MKAEDLKELKPGAKLEIIKGHWEAKVMSNDGHIILVAMGAYNPNYRGKPNIKTFYADGEMAGKQAGYPGGHLDLLNITIPLGFE